MRKAIDGEKLLDRAYEIYNEYTAGGGLEKLMEEVESGTFDLKEAPKQLESTDVEVMNAAKSVMDKYSKTFEALAATDVDVKELCQKCKSHPRFEDAGLCEPCMLEDSGFQNDAKAIREEFVLQLLTKLAELKKQNRNLQEAWNEQKEEIRSLHAGYTSANARTNELYFWEPYAENHLETLTGGVVIRAEWIRQLIAEAAAERESEVERLREKLKTSDGQLQIYKRLNVKFEKLFHEKNLTINQAMEALEYQAKWLRNNDMNFAAINLELKIQSIKGETT